MASITGRLKLASTKKGRFAELEVEKILSPLDSLPPPILSRKIMGNFQLLKITSNGRILQNIINTRLITKEARKSP